MMVVAVEMTRQGPGASRSRAHGRRARDARPRAGAGVARQGRVPGDAGPRAAQSASPIVTALALMGRRRAPTPAASSAMIARQVKHVIRLVDDLLDVSRVTRGKIELRRDDCDVSVARGGRARDRGARSSSSAAISSQVDVTPNLRWHGDATRLEAGDRESAVERRALHPRPAVTCDLSVAADGATRHSRAGRRPGAGPGAAAPSLRAVRSGSPRRLPQRRRPRARPGGGQGSGRAARRVGERDSDGPGRGSEFVVRLPGLSRTRHQHPRMN